MYMVNLEAVSIKVGEREKSFLLEIAAHFKLFKRSSNDLSCAKSLQYLIEYCLQNNISPIKKDDSNITDIRRMIEQIHASIPHLMYQNSLQSTILVSDIDDDKFSAAKQKSIDYISNNIGGFQNTNYKYVRYNINKIGIKTVPNEQGYNLWNARKNEVSNSM